MHHFDFLGKAKYFVPISILLVVLSWILVIPGVRGLNPGIDFSGGTEFTVKFSEPVTTAEVRSALAEIPAPIDLSKSVIQNVAGKNTMVITTQLDVEANQSTIKAIEDTLRSKFKVEDVSRYSIGKQVSRELMQKGWQAVLLALVVILVYVSWRFRLRYAVGAVVALIHDVSIALGVFALFHIEVNLATIAAFLTIVGYSLNDTIVIFDRIRENLKIDRKASIFDIINKSVNQSLSRTLNTSLTTFIPVFIMFLFGGSVLRGFALALLIGVIVGT
ncbi:protein translocase subunit SecF, partial [Candidatus Acetothermia bacterium]